MTLATNIADTYSDEGPTSRALHQIDHDEIHRLVNGVALQPRLGEVGRSKWAHVQRDHGAIQAAIADLGTSGTSTITQIETKINAILAVLRTQGAILG